MHLLVSLSLVGAGEPAAAGLAGKGLLAGVGPNVCGEVVGARETAQADVALERFLARVDAEVSGQLIRSREPLATVLHWTDMRFL